ncbi:glycosyltransferase family 15 protein [Mycena rebaudengoi]|nr:glycosyltransferase family 15 protein [Mycena rebaudengoi]
MFLSVLSRRRYVVFVVVLMSLFYFMNVALRDGAIRTTSELVIEPPHQPEEQVIASVPEPQPSVPEPQLSVPEPQLPAPLDGAVEGLSYSACGAGQRANATLLMLARNSDLNGALSSVKQMEERFNKHCKYPWIFLNEEPFTAEFIGNMTKIIGPTVSFGQVSQAHWYQPGWINETLAEEGRNKMVAQNIIYAESVPYRNMCRFNSGFFFQHPLLQPYRYYWRVEPDIEYFCDLAYDPFWFMEQNDKIYGFTISFYEWEPTIPTLWANVKEFIAKYPHFVAEDNAMAYLSDDGGKTYNLCHFWSNFEIADMDFWRGEAYQTFFDFLESKGGFYYERWGDAPVHSIAVALFAPRHKLHFFKDIGYRHPPFQHCPQGADWEKGKCTCDKTDTLDYRDQSCIPRYLKLSAQPEKNDHTQ